MARTVQTESNQARLNAEVQPVLANLFAKVLKNPQFFVILRPYLTKVDFRHANTHGILEFLIAALIDAFHQRQGIVDKIIHMSVPGDHILGKLFQHLFVCKVAHKVVTLLFVDYANSG